VVLVEGEEGASSLISAELAERRKNKYRY